MKPVARSSRVAATVTAASACVAVLAFSPSGVAAADDGKPPPATVAVPSSGTAATLSGYVQIASGSYTVPAGTRKTSGFADCPDGTDLVGGGAVVAGFNIYQKLSGTVPSLDVLWTADLNNPSKVSATYTVYAICLTSIPGEAIGAGDVVNIPANSQKVIATSCPSGTVPYGGGGRDLSNSAATIQTSVNSSFPTATGWRSDMNSSPGKGTQAATNVICGTAPDGYVQVRGATVTVPPMKQVTATANCPAGTKVLSGGGLSSSSSPKVTMNSSHQSGSTGWAVSENNTLTTATTITPYAVCATIAP